MKTGKTDFRKQLIDHILMMKKHDETYAREALKWYAATLPWLGLMAGVRAALEDGSKSC